MGAIIPVSVPSVKKQKVYYSCPYTDGETVGYVMAIVGQRFEGESLHISRKQYEAACKRLPIGGDVSPVFHTDLPLFVGSDRNHFGFQAN